MIHPLKSHFPYLTRTEQLIVLASALVFVAFAIVILTVSVNSGWFWVGRFITIGAALIAFLIPGRAKKRARGKEPADDAP